MTELNNRVDLMNDVSGYGAMIMANNHKFTGGAYKTIPFNVEYGPSTPWSVTVDTANNRFVLKAGAWSVNLLLAVPEGTVISGSTWFRPAITVYRANGTEYLSQWLDWSSASYPHAFFAQIPLVIPDDSLFWTDGVKAISISSTVFVSMIIAGIQRALLSCESRLNFHSLRERCTLAKNICLNLS